MLLKFSLAPAILYYNQDTPHESPYGDDKTGWLGKTGRFVFDIRKIWCCSQESCGQAPGRVGDHVI